MFGVGNLFFNFKFLVYICLFYILYKIEKLIKKKKEFDNKFFGCVGCEIYFGCFFSFYDDIF